LAQSSLRLSVFVQWVWTYMTEQRGSRIIINCHPTPVMPAAETATKPAAEAPVSVSNR
jgi:NADH:ubiquinone reductase (H+-translocating)